MKMVDIEEVYVEDLYKKHKGKGLNKGFFSMIINWKGVYRINIIYSEKQPDPAT